MKLSIEDWFIAQQILTGKALVPIDDEASELELPSYTIDPEKALLKKEALKSLSAEAQEVIDMIVKSPTETIKALSTPTGLLTKRSIKLGLYKIWHSKFIAKQVIEELTQWVKHL